MQNLYSIVRSNGSYVFTPKELVARDAEKASDDWKDSFTAAGMWENRDDIDTFVEDIRKESDEHLEHIFSDKES